MEEKIKKIHKSDIYGIIVECGCAATLANQLMEVEGSSKTIYNATQPYSKEVQENLYPSNGKYSRSVSYEFVKTALSIEMKKNLKIDFILITSWQMNIKSGSIHGWYGIFYKNTQKFFHVTIKEVPGWYEFHRRKALKTIANIGTIFMDHLIDGNWDFTIEIPDTSMLIMIDDVRDWEGNYDFDSLFVIQQKSSYDYPIVFDKEIPIRFEKLARKSKDGMIIQKGSFDPLHHQHVAIMTESIERKVEQVNPVFLISTDRYDKPNIGYDELKIRIKQINKHGYPLIIMKSIYFYETFDVFKKIGGLLKFFFPIGTDTMNRIYTVDLKTQNDIKEITKKYSSKFKFLLFDRPGYELDEDIKTVYQELIETIEDYKGNDVSSTKIRNGEMKNLLDN